MSLLSKTITAIGERITRNGVRENTLSHEVDKALEIAFGQIRGNVVNVIQKVDFAANQALITILYEPVKAVTDGLKQKKDKGGNEK